MNAATAPNMIKAAVVALSGGLDLVTPPLVMKAGRCIAGSNYEPTNAGYRRCDGYERLDGRPKPSAANYFYMTFSSGNTGLLAGATITGATSGATGKLLINQVATSGSFGGGTAVGYLVLTATSGAFVSGENLQVGGVTKAVSTSVGSIFGAPDDADNTTWARLAIDTARALIQAVPGQGQLRGVWWFRGAAYAVRDNVGATAGILYKSSATGWQVVALGLSLPFTSGGVTAIAVGNTITGATSGATAVITKVVLVTGSWAGGDAAGYFSMASKTGNFVAENLNVGAALNLATIAANATANTLPAGGRYEFVNYNFHAGASTKAMYGCNGVSKAFEFDGTVFAFITSGQSADTPIHMAAHQNRLFLAFRGGLLDCSIAGSPGVFNGVLGAAEFGMGYEITAIMGEILNTLFVFSSSQIKVLYGTSADPTSADPFILKPLSPESGAEEWSVQNVGLLTYKDQQGIRTTSSTQAYGDFALGTLSEFIRPLLQNNKSNNVSVMASLRSRAKTHYRVYFSDGSGLTVYLGKTRFSYGNQIPQPEIIPFNLGKTVYVTCSVEEDDNIEVMLMGSDDGYVYQLDSGTSLDGAAMLSFLRLAFDASGTPSYEKRYKKLVVEVDKDTGQADTAPTPSLYLGAEFSYADPDQPSVQQQSFAITGGGGFYDEDNWNQFFWDAAVFGRAEAYIDGLGRNISLTIWSSATYEKPHTLHGYELQYAFRRMSR